MSYTKKRESIGGYRLGTYEMIDPSRNHNKFYRVWWSKDGSLVADYGRIGSKSPARIYFENQYQAEQKIEEKMRKGYKWVWGSYTDEMDMLVSHMESNLIKKENSSAPVVKKRL